MVDGVKRDDGLKNVNQILVFVYLFVAVVIFLKFFCCCFFDRLNLKDLNNRRVEEFLMNFSIYFNLLNRYRFLVFFRCGFSRI